MRRLQQEPELIAVAVPEKEAVRILTVWQNHGARLYTFLGKPADKRLSRFLTTAVGIGIKGHVDGSRTVTELAELARIEIGAHRAGDDVESGLPQHGVIEESLDQNQFWILPSLVPCVQPAFGSRQETMRRR